MRARRDGYTLIEIMIASAMALVVLGALIRVFLFARGTELDVRSSYLIRQDADEVFRRIQDDLRLTHLASIRVGDGDIGFSMISPLQNSDPSTFALTPYGVAQWKTWVHYSVLAEGDQTGNLVRWELPVPDGTADGIPSTGDLSQPGEQKQSLLPDVLLPQAAILPSSGPGTFSTVGTAKGNSAGGLRLRFVRRDGGKESLSTSNPAQSSDSDQKDWSKGNTGLVDCSLAVGDQSSESGRWSVYQISFRVCPRN
jgi:prepilin-type N-terminal cleavage/methylation domain-containing protein